MELQERQGQLVKRGEKKHCFRQIMKNKIKEEQEDFIRRARGTRGHNIFQAEHDQKLAEELLRRKNADILEEKRRQMLRKDSIELSRFESQLRDSYTATAARMQLLEREVLRENAKMLEVEEARKVAGWYQNDSLEKQQMLEARKRKEQYRRDLQDQLVLNHRLRQQKMEEKRREVELVEEVSQVLRVEDLENQRRKRETAARLHAEERASVEAREFRKFEEKQRLLKEQKEHARILAEKMDVEKQRNDAKAAAAAARTAALEKMAKRVASEQSKKQERADELNELIMDKERNKLDNQEKSAALEKSATAKGFLEDMRRRELAIKELRAREAEEDRAFADYIARERDMFVAADKRKEEEHRAKGIEYGKSLREAMMGKSIDYALEILERQTMLNWNRKLEETKRISIEEERRRMLEEYQERLRGLLKPSTVLFEPQRPLNKAPSPCNY